MPTRQLRRTSVVPRVVVVAEPAQPGETAYADLVAAAGTEVPAAADPERLAVLLYTSGTSGRPRAAMLSHRALLANIEQAARIEPPMLTGDDVVLGVLPLFHVYGLNAVLGQVLHRRARLVLALGFDMDETLSVIEDEAVTVLPVAPPVFAYWQAVPDLGERLGHVRLVLSGSAPLSRELVDDFEQRTGIAVHQGYGLTEAAPVVTSTLHSGRDDDGRAKAGLRRRRPARHRDPAGRRGRPAPPRAGTRARSGSAATTCSAATGPTGPTVPTARAGTPPATSGSSTRTATCSWSTGSRSW